MLQYKNYDLQFTMSYNLRKEAFSCFPLLFWHERFLLFQISRLQVNLKKKKQLVSYRTSFDGI